MDIGDAIKKAVESAIEGHYKQDREVTKIVRAKTIKDRQHLTEMFPLRVEHIGHRTGRDAVITIDGCPRRFEVKQRTYEGQRNNWQKGAKARWDVQMFNGTNYPVLVETVDDFQSAVQHCIVALIGHAYYDGVA
jgi:hypothetical protein